MDVIKGILGAQAADCQMPFGRCGDEFGDGQLDPLDLVERLLQCLGSMGLGCSSGVKERSFCLKGVFGNGFAEIRKVIGGRASCDL